MSEPKNQHIIPKCYLKQFVDPKTPRNQEPYVWVFDRGTKLGKRKAPKNVLTEAHFYTLTNDAGEKDYSIERKLSLIEGNYAAVFDRKIKKRIPLDDQEHQTLCIFVAVMLQRTLKQRENIEQFFDQVIEQAEALENAHGIDPTMSVQWKKDREDVHKISTVQMIPTIAEILLKMNLAFLCTNKSNSFITSDSPCVVFNAELQWQRMYGPGLGQKHVEVHMPLSPEMSLCFSWVNNLRGYLEIGSDINGTYLSLWDSHFPWIISLDSALGFTNMG